MTLTEATGLISRAQIDQVYFQTWADLGCGNGLFSRALAQLLPLESTIICCDQRVQELPEIEMGVHLQFTQLDFAKENLKLPLDGILMANSLHYVRDKKRFIDLWETSIKPQSKWIIVEYDTSAVNPYIPYPLPYKEVKTLFPEAKIKKLGEYPSIFGAMMYACEVSFQ